MFDVVEPRVHDGSMEVDDRPHCDELRTAWVMTYLLPVIATRRFSPRLRTSDNGNLIVGALVTWAIYTQGQLLL